MDQLTTLPTSVLNYSDTPPAEDLILAILRAKFPDLRTKADGQAIGTLVDLHQTFPFVLVRRGPSYGAKNLDPMFVEQATINIVTFTDGIEADSDAAILHDAVKKALYEARRSQKVFPHLGHICAIRTLMPARRVTDWASSVGPVQYADLPSGVLRYEAIYDIGIRLPDTPIYHS